MKFEYRETQGGYLAELAYENQKEYFKTDVLEKDVEKVVEKVVDKLNNTQQKIVLLMKKEPFITATDISKQIEISHRKVQTNIAKLKQKGIISRLGSDKGGHWEVNNK